MYVKAELSGWGFVSDQSHELCVVLGKLQTWNKDWQERGKLLTHVKQTFSPIDFTTVNTFIKLTF